MKKANLSQITSRDLIFLLSHFRLHPSSFILGLFGGGV
jgi:hypothetical protein